MLFDESLMECWKKWIKQTYEKNHYNLLENVNLAYKYCHLFKLFNIENEVLSDNLKRVYLYSSLNNEVGTIIGMIMIHRYCFIGISVNPGLLQTLQNGHHNPRFISILFDPRESEWNKYSILRNLQAKERERSERLLEISQMPSFTYYEIIEKYYSLLKFSPFAIGNEDALSIWVNLLLNKKLGTMIDWRKVDKRRLYNLIYNPKDMCNYLEPFLSSTYLNEIKASITT